MFQKISALCPTFLKPRLRISSTALGTFHRAGNATQFVALEQQEDQAKLFLFIEFICFYLFLCRFPNPFSVNNISVHSIDHIPE